MLSSSILHISKDEQKEPLQARLDDPTKTWKFNSGDSVTANCGMSTNLPSATNRQVFY